MTACFLIINRVRKFFENHIFQKVETDLTIPPYYNKCINMYDKPPIRAKSGQMYYNTKDGKIYIYSEKNGWLDFNVENDVE